MKLSADKPSVENHSACNSSDRLPVITVPAQAQNGEVCGPMVAAVAGSVLGDDDVECSPFSICQ
jgi:hypothetical protein